MALKKEGIEFDQKLWKGTKWERIGKGSVEGDGKRQFGRDGKG